MMIKQLSIIVVGLTTLVACNTDVVETKKDPVVKDKPSNSTMTKAELDIEPKSTIVEKKNFMNGMKIQWFEKGNGPAVEQGSVYELNFKIKLVDGTIVDGNHLLKKDWIPFLVGYNMQTSGWDIALSELHVGDFVELYLPPKLARGEKGVPGVIPPNAPNIIFLRVGKELKPNWINDGVKVWLWEEQEANKSIVIGETSSVEMHYFVGTKSHPRFDNSYKRSIPYSFNMTDFSLLPGLRKGLMGRKLFDKLWMVVPSKLAYGTKGYVDIVKPNEDLFFDLFIINVDGKAPESEAKSPSVR